MGPQKRPNVRRIFISWSGNESRQIGKAFAKLIQAIVPPDSVQTFFSTDDIIIGEQWMKRLTEELEAATHVVVCLTPLNMDARWLYFEAGAIAGKPSTTMLVTLSIGIAQEEIPTPFSTYQALKPSFDNVLKFIDETFCRGPFAPLTISEAQGLLQNHWGQFESEVEVARLTIEDSPPKPSIGGIVNFFPRRDDLAGQIPNGNWWEQKFFTVKRSPKRVLLMSQTMYPTFQSAKQCSAFIKWCTEDNTKVNILLLSPSRPELAQTIAISRWIKSPRRQKVQVADPLKILPQLIEETVSLLVQNVLRHIPTDKRPSVRFAHCDLPFGLNVIDDEMYVTPYGTQPEADLQPTLRIHGTNSAAYQSYFSEFWNIWDYHSTAYQYEDVVVKLYRPNVQSLLPLKHPPAIVDKLKSPTQAIILPTYICSAGCSYCMFSNFRNEDAPASSMDAKDFRRVLNQMRKGRIKIERLEITGGGEPLEHQDINGILTELDEASEKWREDGSDGIRLGLITNGLHIGAVGPERLLKTFDDYIRVSLCEPVFESLVTKGSHGKLYQAWRSNVCALLSDSDEDLYGRRRTTIGIKLLLEPGNSNSFVSAVEKLLEDDDLCSGIGHWRFRSSRTIVNNKVLSETEEKVHHLLMDRFSTDELSEKVSLSMSHTRYAPHLRCWASLVHVVVSPEREVLRCCNFSHRKREKHLGKLSIANDLESIWFSQRHANAIDKWVHCQDDPYANCRIAEIQELYDTYGGMALE